MGSAFHICISLSCTEPSISDWFEMSSCHVLYIMASRMISRLVPIDNV